MLATLGLGTTHSPHLSPGMSRVASAPSLGCRRMQCLLPQQLADLALDMYFALQLQMSRLPMARRAATARWH